MLEAPDLSVQVRRVHPKGVDTVLDLIRNSAVLDSLACGWQDSWGAARQSGLSTHCASGAHLSFFASAFTFGSQEYPLSGIPFSDHCRAGGGRRLSRETGACLPLRGNPGGTPADRVRLGKRQDCRLAELIANTTHERNIIMERLQNRVSLVTGGNSGIATAVETTCVGGIRSFGTYYRKRSLLNWPCRSGLSSCEAACDTGNCSTCSRRMGRA
jgi:hypothetical protein